MVLSIDVYEARDRQQVRLAIQYAEQWGDTRPRRWLARYGDLAPCRGADASEINKEYRNHYRRISGSVKPVRESLAW